MMTANNKLFFGYLVFPMCFILLNSMIVSAIIIEDTSANQNTYQNGDLITLIIQTNAQEMEVTGDFSALDSNFQQEMVIVESKGTTYYVSYPITFSNSNGDNEYNSVISFYDPTTGTSSTVTYGIHLENQEQRKTDTEILRINVEEEEEEIIVEEGYIQLCRPSGCETITESEYEASRQIIIKDGNVTLSDLTYNQLKKEITNSANKEIRSQLQQYLVQISDIKSMLDQKIYELDQLVAQQSNITNHTLIESNEIVKAGNRNNIVAMIVVLLLIASFSYLIYLRTETTWLSR